MTDGHEITAIRTRRGVKRREIEVDGVSWRFVPGPVVNALGLSVGARIDIDELAAQIAEVEPQAARERALRLLAYRERTEAEMRGRLADDGYSAPTIDTTLERLLDTGLLDDRRYAEQTARVLVEGRGYGRSRALRSLRRSGLDEELVTEFVDTYAPAEAERDRALVAARRAARPGDTVDRLGARLVRRGFAVADALSAARVVIAPNVTSEDHRDDVP